MTESELNYITRAECEINGCNNSPEWEAAGQLNFSHEGIDYEMNRTFVCDDHRDVIEDATTEDN